MPFGMQSSLQRERQRQRDDDEARENDAKWRRRWAAQDAQERKEMIEENQRLAARVRELESENNSLKGGNSVSKRE